MIENLTPPIKGLILDMDGVLWRGSEPIGDLPAIFARIRVLGLKFVLATNNSVRTPEEHLDKLREFGVDLGTDKLINSSMAVIYLLRRYFPDGGAVYVIGSSGLKRQLAEAGYPHAEENVLAVVAGLDREFTFEKLARANRLIRAGAKFIGTNPDVTFPMPDGLGPGAGSILAAIAAAAQTEPVIAGKPHTPMMEIALQRMGTTPETTLVVGDRLDTDIASAQKIGCRTAVVLTGISTPEAVRKWSPPVDLVGKDLAAVLDMND